MLHRLPWTLLCLLCLLALPRGASAQEPLRKPKPELVHVLWMVPTPTPDVLNIETESGVVAFADSHKKQPLRCAMHFSKLPPILTRRGRSMWSRERSPCGASRAGC